jgi:phosphoribosyl-ATP pyrophosphohydrolase
MINTGARKSYEESYEYLLPHKHKNRVMLQQEPTASAMHLIYILQHVAISDVGLLGNC